MIRDSANWDAWWHAHVANVTPAPSTPKVDFASQMVLAVTMGERPTGGYAVAISDVTYGAGGDPLLVVVRETAPLKDAIVTQALTAPYHFVTVPRWSGTVQFGVLDEPISP